MLTFNSDRHEYAYNGKVVPSVTQILSIFSDFSKVNKEVLEFAQNRGTNIHKVLELYDTKNLSEETALAYEPYLIQWNKFIKDFQVGFTGSEMKLYSAKWQFAGTPDRVGSVNNKLTIIDIKTGIKTPSHALQTAGYKILCEENGFKIKNRLSVYINENGYKITEHKQPSDEMIFLSALNIFNWKINNNIKEN